MSRNNVINNLVQETTDYDQFTYMDQNREVDRPHVNHLIKEMEEYGNFTKSQPILVNERLEVIDGQHRLEACKSLNLPVFFTVVRGLTIVDARKMNILQKNWTGRDYLHTYVEEGLPAYKKIEELVDTYDDFSLTVILLYAVGQYTRGYNADYRNGTFDNFDLEKVKQRLDKLSELSDVSPAFKTRSLAIALLEIMQAPEYSHERLLEKVKSNPTLVKSYQSVADNMRQLEDLYNKDRTNKVRLF